LKNVLRFISLSLIWGSGFFWIKVSLRGLYPAEIVVARMIVAAMFMYLMTRVTHLRLPHAKGTWLHLAVMATCANIIPYFLLAWGELRVTSEVAGILNATTPLFTLLINYGVGRDGPRLNQWLGAFVGFFGVVILVQPWHAAISGDFTSIVACLTVAICYAGSYVYAHHFLVGTPYSPLALSAGQFIVGAGLACLGVPFLTFHHNLPPMESVVGVVMLGAVCSGVAYSVNYGLIRHKGSSTASMVTHVVPVTAVALGVLVLHEAAQPPMFIGGAVVLVGVWLVEQGAGDLRELPVTLKRLRETATNRLMPSRARTLGSSHSKKLRSEEGKISV
jgi:drug/metabolite transporter (DMT)-like permease